MDKLKLKKLMAFENKLFEEAVLLAIELKVTDTELAYVLNNISHSWIKRHLRSLMDTQQDNDNSKQWKEWLEVTTSDDIADGIRVFKEKHTGEIMRINNEQTG